MARLRRSDCSEPGIRRIRHGRGFRYLEETSGEPVRDGETLERIGALVIPPAWNDVWICPDPLGHLQAVGVDDAGRRQYRYHERWLERRSQAKFDRMVSFARALPSVRRRTKRRLRAGGLGRDRVLSGAIQLLDRGFFRIGGEEYATENGSYGLVTMCCEHVRLERRGAIVFDYPSKGGRRRVESVVDPDLLRLVSELKRRGERRRRLLRYSEEGEWRDVRSGEVNTYLQELTGADFTAKDFRTWSGTVLTAVALARGSPPTSRTARRRAIAEALAEVSDVLGNTPAVLRSSYVDPRVLDRFRSGVTISDLVGRLDGTELRAVEVRGEVEQAVLELVE
jgi:DNA topoisomerase I